MLEAISGINCLVNISLYVYLYNKAQNLLHDIDVMHIKVKQCESLYTQYQIFSSPLHSVLFAGVSGCIGLSILWFACNPLTATLGAMNIVLYTLVYTPMKRFSISNTWIGSVVGSIPPLMGCVASSGQLDVGE